MRKNTLLFFLSIVFPVLLFSNVQRYERTIVWKGVKTINIDDGHSISVLDFDGAGHKLDLGVMPVYAERFSIPFKDFDFNVELRNQIFEPIPQDQLPLMENAIVLGSEVLPDKHLSMELKKPYASVSFIPIRKNEITGFYERLVSFEVVIEVDENSSFLGPQAKDYIDNSVLGSGSWYKLAVKQDGIYKISYQELADMGMGVASINPKNIRVYGNGGGMLPENPTKQRYDDLMENAIFVSGEDDGSFDPGDYVLFYGQSPHEWKLNPITQKWHNEMNVYANANYYFITADHGEGKRIENSELSTLDPDVFVNDYWEGFHHEIDETNLIKTGRTWYGETFDLFNNLVVNYNIPNIDLTSKVYIKGYVAARSKSSSSFSFYANNSNILTLPCLPVSDAPYSAYANAKSDTSYFYPPGSNFSIEVVYSKPTNSAVGWLNYFTLNVRRKLRFEGGQLSFSDMSPGSQTNIAKYTLSNGGQGVVIWDLSDGINVKSVNASLSGDQMIWKMDNDSLKKFVVFDGTSFFSAEFAGIVENQNLHGDFTDYDFLIITHPAFLEQANRLAQHHRNHDNMQVLVSQLPDIYNEFSSGKQDITAIRDYVKMFYDRATNGGEPKYLLLFGDGSYDYKNRVNENTNYVPVWESVASLRELESVATDDFYGYLDDVPDDTMLDIGIGRFVVSSVEQATQAVDKTIHYAVNTDAVMDDWRNIVCLVADDEDSNLHLNDAEKLFVIIDSTDKTLNVEKIYLDAYPQVATSSGEKYPDVQFAINDRIERGALIFNYAGHGGELGLAHERIMTTGDINSWDNYDNLTVFVTATCEFSRFDDPTRTSAGEQVFLNPNGGAVALYTTTRATYAGGNSTLNKYFYKFLFETVDGEHHRMGDVMRLAKNLGNTGVNGEKFLILGDPALHFAFPKEKVITLAINDVFIEEAIDTIRALSEVTISGELQDNLGNKLSDFQGYLFPTIFDKPSRFVTIGNDDTSIPVDFYVQKNALYKGKVSVIDGAWSFTFIAPKDIAYQYGYGKFSFYAKNENTDAAGYFTDVVVGGYNQFAEPDFTGPTIEMYMNDESFINNGITDENPDLLAYLWDDQGINTVGSGIGHDILATLDGGKAYVMNNYYESGLDDYKSGKILYPFYNLSTGPHTLELKVWDIHNNSATGKLDFIVANSESMAIEELMNYPNPFYESTTFSFEHNLSGADLEIIVQVFSLQGQLMKTIRDVHYSEGYKYKSGKWAGTDDGGNKLPGGMYVYRVKVR
ncbi:MAG: hypothetical protein DRJ05_08335, partial [Bacteroidetes bacterium]